MLESSGLLEGTGNIMRCEGETSLLGSLMPCEVIVVGPLMHWSDSSRPLDYRRYERPTDISYQ